MKLLKKFLFFLLFLFALFTTFVLVCAFNPALTRRVADFLYPERTGEGMSAGAEAGRRLLGRSRFLETRPERTACPVKVIPRMSLTPAGMRPIFWSRERQTLKNPVRPGPT